MNFLKVKLSRLFRNPLERILIPLSPLLIAVILTATNNYYYYESKDVTVKSQQQNLLRYFEDSINACIRLSGDLDNCFKEHLKSSNYRFPGKFTITHDDTIIQTYENEWYTDIRRSISTERNVLFKEDEYTLFLTKLTSPTLSESVFRSVTFSLFDIANLYDNGLDNYISYTLPRSRPFFVFFVVSLFLYYLFIFREFLWSNKQDKIDKQLDQESLRIEGIIKSKKELESKLNILKSDTDRLKNQLSLKQSNVEKENNNEPLVIANDKINSQKCEIIKLESKLKLRAENYSQLETKSNQVLIDSSSSSFPKKFARALLKNPNIELKTVTLSTSKGRHHSKDFVDIICKQVSKDLNSTKFVNEVYSIRYQPNKKGTVELIFDKDKKHYGLYIYDKSDRGYGACILLSTNINWEAVIYAKYLINALSNLKQFKLTFKKTEAD